jgi:hypothetical protein
MQVAPLPCRLLQLAKFRVGPDLLFGADCKPPARWPRSTVSLPDHWRGSADVRASHPRCLEVSTVLLHVRAAGRLRLGSPTPTVLGLKPSLARDGRVRPAELRRLVVVIGWRYRDPTCWFGDRFPGGLPRPAALGPICAHWHWRPTSVRRADARQMRSLFVDALRSAPLEGC